MPGFDTGSVMFALNVDFTGNSLTEGTAQVTTDGQLLIGSSVAPNIRVGTLTSGDGSILITPGNGTLATAMNLASNADTIAGVITNKANTPASLAAKLGPQTANTIIVGNGPANPLRAIAPTSVGGNWLVNSGTSVLEYIPANYMPGASNIGIAYAGGTFTVQGYDGTALSATNPGYITLQSKATPGRFVTIAVTANQTFTDGSAGTTDNARFGVTTGVNWASDIPFYLYGVMDDTATLIAFMISRNPCAIISPVSTGISKSGSIINVNTSDFFSLANVTVTSYDANPCICIGSFRMQFAGATDSMTVQTLGSNDGIGQFQQGRTFSMVAGQNGAAASTFFLNNPGTEPQFTTQLGIYMIGMDGFVDYTFSGTNVSVAGVGANILQPILPYTVAVDANNAPQMTGYYNDDSAAQTYFSILGGVDSGQTYITGIGLGGSAGLQLNTGYAANDDLVLTLRYPAYRTN